MATASSESLWAWLPKHLLDSISDNLILLSDYVRFSAVCTQWRLVGQDQKERRIKRGHTHLPMLMIPTKNNRQYRRSLYNVIERKIYDFQLPVPYNKRCCGSSHGWLFIVESDMAITLLNPFLLSSGGINIDNGIIPLPPVMEDPRPCKVQYQVQKVILSADPAITPHNYVVVAIYGSFHRLALIKSGDKSWTYIHEERALYFDVIFYKGQLHGVSHNSRVDLIDVSPDGKEISPNGKEIQVKTVVPKKGQKGCPRTYLVESDGDLLLVQRTLARTDHDLHWMTSGFEVYRLLQNPNGTVEKVEVKDLGDNALFLGDNHSMSVSASNFPGIHPNSIYYTDDYTELSSYHPHGPQDMGIFNLEDGRFALHHTLLPSQKHMPPPFWIVPMLQ